jgi:type I restriction enzyme, R subunit
MLLDRILNRFMNDLRSLYVITNAIADENVLKFSVEYWGKIKRKDGSLITEPKLDREFFENPDRISLIVDWIIDNHNRKTHGRKFSAMLCISSVDTLITYYEIFKAKQKQGLHDLRVVTIFTPGINEADDEANGLIGEPDFNIAEEIFIEPYEYYIDKFNDGVQELRAIAAIPNDVNKLIDEDDQVEFVKAFRNLIRLLNVSKSFTEFDFAALNMDEQTFEDYKSKYLDIYDRTRSRNEEENDSIIEEVDFELELIQRDEINVSYILKLLAELRQNIKTTEEDYQKKKESILDLVGQEVQLRSKRDLIEKFINERMPTLESEDSIATVFQNFWNQERTVAVRQLCLKENLKVEAVNQMIADYKFSGKEPLRETVLNACNEKPKLLERKKIFDRVVSKLLDIINKFDDALGEFEEE